MYVIYINDRPLTLLSASSAGTCAPPPENAPPATHLRARYSGKPRTLLHYADMLEKGSPKVTSVTIEGRDVDQLWADFRSHHKWVPAAGGVVRRKGTDDHLFIHRRGYWDLPKGKIDAGEDAPAAALREVREETGVADLDLGNPLPTTYHTYRTGKGKRVLKPTYWFAMTSEQQALTPEAAEGIEAAVWRPISSVLTGPEPTYASLAALLTDLAR